MTLLRLAWKSLCNRALASILTVISISLSVILLLSVEKARRATEEGFTQSISQVDLIVGARSGPIQLALYTIFNIGSATNNVSYDSYLHWKSDPAVEWTVPYSLGDGHHGYRVIGTNADFFKYYRFRGQEKPEFQWGEPFNGLWDVVVGADVWKNLNYKLGDDIIVAHGVTHGEGILQHTDKPFKIVGLLKPTGTPIDRAVYISLDAMEALHIDWQTGAAPNKQTAVPANKIKPEDLKIRSITSFFLRTKSRIETLKLQRDINDWTVEPLLAIIPGATLGELWNSLSYVDEVLKLISLMVVVVGFFAMLIALLTTLNERRREMAILRSLGATPRHIFSLLIFESFLLSTAGAGLGAGFVILIQLTLAPWISNQVGLYIKGPLLNGTEIIYLVGIIACGTVMGTVPAMKALRQSLKDGLSVHL
jgi:putative ABC transport system permease protein